MSEENFHPNHSYSGDSVATRVDYSRLGYRKLELPLSSPVSTESPLRRTYSEPLYNLGNMNSALPQIRTSPCSPLQENAVRYVGQEACPTPNGSPFIQRTVSDPNPFASPPAPVMGRTPPRPPRSRDASPSCGEEHSAKRKKGLRERAKEISEWCNAVMLETDLGASESEISEGSVKEQSKENMGTRYESVSVEKKGNALSLQFKCPCGHGYEFLLEGKNCYYKLTDS